MKQQHILNIGFPRCATTWLWNILIDHPMINFPWDQKENSLIFDALCNDYENFYNQYDISANFNPNLWMIDQELIKYLGQHATHVSIILRNPYNFIERYYDFVGRSMKPNEFIDFLIGCNYVDYSKIVNRWVTNISSSTKFKIFYFDVIEANPKIFLSKYFEFINLDAIMTNDVDQIYNETIHQSRTSLNFTSKQREIINQQIVDFSKTVNTDFSHWIK